MTCTTSCYYSFKIFLLYKNVRATHHNQLLSTKFKLKELCDTSTGDVNRAANLQMIELLTEKTWG